jgi:hypothetical protein
VDDGVAIYVVDAGHNALFEFVFEVTRMWRRTDRANLEKKPWSSQQGCGSRR